MLRIFIVPLSIMISKAIAAIHARRKLRIALPGQQ